MSQDFLKNLDPARWLTSFACWWLNIDTEDLNNIAKKHEQNCCCSPQSQIHITNNQLGAHEITIPDKSCDHPNYDVHAALRPIWVASVKDKLFSWDFNVFDLDVETQGHPLYSVSMALMEAFGLLDGWKLDREHVENFFTRVENDYCANSYHNNTHAADVTQTVAVILQSFKLELSKMEIFCVILASAIHDLGHLGVNNDFLINSKHQRATTYNDKSVNEMYHVCRAFEIIREYKECDIFNNFTRDEQKKIRKLVIDMVLATDMAIHFDLLKNFTKEIEEKPIEEWADKSLLFQMIVHLADIANPSRPFHLARGWAERVIQEFLFQGDREDSIGLPISPFCNRANMCMPRAQLNFIDIFLKPTLLSFRKAAPEFTSMSLTQLEVSIKEWSALEASGFKL